MSTGNTYAPDDSLIVTDGNDDGRVLVQQSTGNLCLVTDSANVDTYVQGENMMTVEQDVTTLYSSIDTSRLPGLNIPKKRTDSHLQDSMHTVQAVCRKVRDTRKINRQMRTEIRRLERRTGGRRVRIRHGLGLNLTLRAPSAHYVLPHRFRSYDSKKLLNNQTYNIGNRYWNNSSDPTLAAWQATKLVVTGSNFPTSGLVAQVTNAVIGAPVYTLPLLPGTTSELAEFDLSPIVDVNLTDHTLTFTGFSATSEATRMGLQDAAGNEIQFQNVGYQATFDYYVKPLPTNNMTRKRLVTIVTEHKTTVPFDLGPGLASSRTLQVRPHKPKIGRQDKSTFNGITLSIIGVENQLTEANIRHEMGLNYKVNCTENLSNLEIELRTVKLIGLENVQPVVVTSDPSFIRARHRVSLLRLPKGDNNNVYVSGDVYWNMSDVTDTQGAGAELTLNEMIFPRPEYDTLPTFYPGALTYKAINHATLHDVPYPATLNDTIAVKEGSGPSKLYLYACLRGPPGEAERRRVTSYLSLSASGFTIPYPDERVPKPTKVFKTSNRAIPITCTYTAIDNQQYHPIEFLAQLRTDEHFEPRVNDPDQSVKYLKKDICEAVRSRLIGQDEIVICSLRPLALLHGVSLRYATNGHLQAFSDVVKPDDVLSDTSTSDSSDNAGTVYPCTNRPVPVDHTLIPLSRACADVPPPLAFVFDPVVTTSSNAYDLAAEVSISGLLPGTQYRVFIATTAEQSLLQYEPLRPDVSKRGLYSYMVPADNGQDPPVLPGRLVVPDSTGSVSNIGTVKELLMSPFKQTGDFQIVIVDMTGLAGGTKKFCEAVPVNDGGVKVVVDPVNGWYGDDVQVTGLSANQEVILRVTEVDSEGDNSWTLSTSTQSLLLNSSSTVSTYIEKIDIDAATNEAYSGLQLNADGSGSLRLKLSDAYTRKDATSYEVLDEPFFTQTSMLMVEIVDKNAILNANHLYVPSGTSPTYPMNDLAQVTLDDYDQVILYRGLYDNVNRTTPVREMLDAVPDSPVPTLAQTEVISFYSDSYTTDSIAPASWSALTTGIVNDQIKTSSNQNVMKIEFDNTSTISTGFTSQTPPLNPIPKQRMHIDVFAQADNQSLALFLVDGSNSTTSLAYSFTGQLVTGQWTSFDIQYDETKSVSAMVLTSAEGSTFFLDNIYFYTPTQPLTLPVDDPITFQPLKQYLLSDFSNDPDPAIYIQNVFNTVDIDVVLVPFDKIQNVTQSIYNGNYNVINWTKIPGGTVLTGKKLSDLIDPNLNDGDQVFNTQQTYDLIVASGPYKLLYDQYLGRSNWANYHSSTSNTVTVVDNEIEKLQLVDDTSKFICIFDGYDFRNSGVSAKVRIRSTNLSSSVPLQFQLRTETDEMFLPVYYTASNGEWQDLYLSFDSSSRPTSSSSRWIELVTTNSPQFELEISVPEYVVQTPATSGTWIAIGTDPSKVSVTGPDSNGHYDIFMSADSAQGSFPSSIRYVLNEPRYCGNRFRMVASIQDVLVGQTGNSLFGRLRCTAFLNDSIGSIEGSQGIDAMFDFNLPSQYGGNTINYFRIFNFPTSGVSPVDIRFKVTNVEITEL